MKKLFTLLAAAAICSGAWAEQVTVADGTATEQRIPVCGNYYDFTGKYTHFIYPASMLAEMEGCDITSMTFYATAAIGFGGGNETLDVKVVEETSIYDQVTTGLTRLFTGTFVPEGDKLTITFDNPFTYEGGNLLFAVTWDGSGNYADASFYGVEATGASIWYSYGSTLINFLPKTTFEYVAETADYAARIDNTALEFGNVASNNLPATLTVTLTNRGTNAITPSVTLTGDGFATSYVPAELAKGEKAEIPVTLSATATGEYSGTLTITAFEGEGGTFVVPVSAVITEPVYEFTVADGTSTSNYFPMYFYYWDEGCHTQTIYNKADLAALAGKSITSLTYYPNSAPDLQLNGEATISLGTTDLNFFYGNEAFVETTACGKWAPNADGSFTITLDTPFAYDGEKNLVVDWNVTTPGSSFASGMFYGIVYGTSDAEKTFSMYQYSEYPYTSSFIPKTTFGYGESSVGPEVKVGDVDGSGEVDIDDVNAVIRIILGKAAEADYPGNANVDGAGEIDVDDVNAIIRIILNK